MIKNIKKYYIPLLILLLVIAVGFFVFKKSQKSSYTEYTTQRTTVSDILLLAGTVDAVQRVDLGFASSGRVKKVNYTTGDTVLKNQVIAEIEQNRLAAQLNQAQANYTLTRVDTTTNLSSANSSLETIIAEQNAIVDGLYTEYLSGDLRAYIMDDDDPSTIPPTVTGVYTAEQGGDYILEMYRSGADSGYSFRYDGLESGRASALVNSPGQLGDNGLYLQFASGSSYNNTKWIIPVPNTRSVTYAARKRAYESALATRDRVINEAQNNINRVGALDSQTDITRDQAQRAQARAQVNAVAAQLNDGKIRAPFDGIIAKNNLELGEIINAFSPEVVIFGDTSKKITVNTPEIYINKINVGDTVSIILDAYSDEEFTGTVAFIDVIDTEVDGVPVYQTDIVINSDDQRIRVGMNAKVSITSQEVSNVVAIPAHYVKERDDVEFVLRKTGTVPYEYTEQIIETGFRGNDGLVEIVSGVAVDDVVALEQSDN